jgi:NAD-dependent deacetylase
VTQQEFPLSLITVLRAATRVVVLTGAGVSAESGIPTFRDKQTGLWEKFDAAELAAPYAFERDPAFVWGWYEWRRGLVLKAQPNAGHRAIATMQTHVPHFTLITQNVDDLHERAGSRDVLHLHGELSRPYCEGCRRTYSHADGIPDLPAGGALRQDVAMDGVREANRSHASGSQVSGAEVLRSAQAASADGRPGMQCRSALCTNGPTGRRIPPPVCTVCGAKIRPGVVWFGESLPQVHWNAAREAARHCEVFLCCGTSALVQPAASLTQMAIDASANTIQVNPNPTDLDAAVTFAIRGPSGIVLPLLVAETWNIPQKLT